MFYIFKKSKIYILMDSSGLDKFYTNKDVVTKSISQVNELVDLSTFDLILEPSAGNGSFLSALPVETSVGLDIEPENENIIKMNFCVDFFFFQSRRSENKNERKNTIYEY